MIQAIETRYKGYRFRSRLEARWAVFFDYLGIRWRYEAEGFNLPSGRYLPDFEISNALGRSFIEVKGEDPTDLEIALADDLSKESGCMVHIVVGDPLTARSYDFSSQMRARPLNDLDGLVFHAWSWLGFEGAQDPVSVQAAAQAARGARFEHGESGAAR